MVKDVRSGALSIKPTPFSATDLAWPHKSRLSKCPARSDSSLDSDSWVQSKSDSSLDSDSRVQSKVGLPLGLGLLGPKQIGLLLGLGLLGRKQIGLLLGLGLLGPNQIGLLLGLGLLAPRPDRTPKSTPLKTDSYLDSDSVRFLGGGRGGVCEGWICGGLICAPS